MPRRDFFSFCTTLKPIELKALGELSRVRHLEKGELVYRTGDPADEIYSVNRGVVELTSEGESHARDFLVRGEIFGLSDTFGNVARSHSAAAQDLVSLQCFERQNFVAIARRIPTFFYFLCEQIALQSQRGGAKAAAYQHLTGSLANFDLVTVHQTIISSGQSGELRVLNENGERLATFYFQEGERRSGQLQHLTGEEAFWQLFLCDEIPGTFSFSSAARAITDCLKSAEI